MQSKHPERQRDLQKEIGRDLEKGTPKKTKNAKIKKEVKTVGYSEREREKNEVITLGKTLL